MRQDNDDDKDDNDNVNGKRCDDEDDDDDNVTAALGLGLLPPDIQAASTWEVSVTNIEDEIFNKSLIMDLSNIARGTFGAIH